MVEDLHKKREPLVTMEAIYLMTPTEESIHILMRDFEQLNHPMYKAAHVYFSEGTQYQSNLYKIDSIFFQLAGMAGMYDFSSCAFNFI